MEEQMSLQFYIVRLNCVFTLNKYMYYVLCIIIIIIIVFLHRLYRYALLV